MLDLNSLSRPVAVVEMLLLLTFTAFIGWLLARLILNNRINALRSAIADQESELDECKQANLKITGIKLKSAFSAPAYPVASQLAEPEPPLPESPMENAPLALAPERPILDKLAPPELTTPSSPNTSEASVLQRIAARSGEINFDHIGLATAAEADDLKDISGIGPFLERKLHSIGIYTFRQVANFSEQDAEKINELIEFFPGRIIRDNWVEQARKFYELKYGKKEESQS